MIVDLPQQHEILRGDVLGSLEFFFSTTNAFVKVYDPVTCSKKITVQQYFLRRSLHTYTSCTCLIPEVDLQRCYFTRVKWFTSETKNGFTLPAAAVDEYIFYYYPVSTSSQLMLCFWSPYLR